MKNREDNGLEKFIQNNRADFDPYEPPARLWDKITQELDEEAPQVKKKEGKVIRIPVRNLYRVAAAVLILGGLWTVYQNIPQNSGIVEGSEEVATNTINLSDIDPELAEAEAYYTQLIVDKKTEIEQFRSKRVPVQDDFYKDLDELDSLYTGLKSELYEVPAKERVVEAMIQNLQIRIEILNKQLEILNRIQKLQNGEDNNENENKIST